MGKTLIAISILTPESCSLDVRSCFSSVVARLTSTLTSYLVNEGKELIMNVLFGADSWLYWYVQLQYHQAGSNTDKSSTFRRRVKVLYILPISKLDLGKSI